MKSEKIPANLVVLNYKTVDNAAISVDDVPTLVKDSVLATLQENDPNPFCKIEVIEYPVSGTGGVYEGSFFKSYINVCKQRPIPGSKRGHEYTSRPSSDFYMIGGKTEDNGDGTGRAFFKMYIPPVGDPTENHGFIRDAKAGIVHFSLVSAPEYTIKKDPDGVERRHFTKSNGYERNDAVEYGTGAMAQQVNSKEIADLELAREKIENGLISRYDNGEQLFADGRVSRPMLRRMVANADEETRAKIGELISMIDKKANGGNKMELNEAIKIVQNAAANGAINLGEAFAGKIALRNEDDKKNESIILALKNKNLGDDIVAGVDKIIAENRANADAIAKNAVGNAFGPEAFEVDVNGKKESVKNAAFDYAIQKCSGKIGADLENAIAGLKDDAVMKAIRVNQADPHSEVNVLTNSKPADAGNGVSVY